MNFGVTVWGALEAPPQARWPWDIIAPDSWLKDGKEAQVHSYRNWLKHGGLLPYAQVEVPSKQRYGARDANLVWRLPRWVVGLKLHLGETFSEGQLFVVEASRVLQPLWALPSGPARVLRARAVSAVISLSVSNGLEPVAAVLTLLRAYR